LETTINFSMMRFQGFTFDPNMPSSRTVPEFQGTKCRGYSVRFLVTGFRFSIFGV